MRRSLRSTSRPQDELAVQAKPPGARSTRTSVRPSAAAPSLPSMPAGAAASPRTRLHLHQRDRRLALHAPVSPCPAIRSSFPRATACRRCRRIRSMRAYLALCAGRFLGHGRDDRAAPQIYVDDSNSDAAPPIGSPTCASASSRTAASWHCHGVCERRQPDRPPLCRLGDRQRDQHALLRARAGRTAFVMFTAAYRHRPASP